MVKRYINSSRINWLLVTFILLLKSLHIPVSAQEADYKYFYRVSFMDKGNNDINDFNLQDLISPKAIERRNKAGIYSPDFKDIPVYQGYIDEISSKGFTLHCTSKWMNTALFKTVVPADLTSLVSLPYVNKVNIVKSPGIKYGSYDKLTFKTTYEDLPPYDRPLSMINGTVVQNSGFTGKNVLIAVLDAGFSNVDNISSLAHLRNRNGIKGTYDFVRRNSFVYDYHNHGTAVLSVLSGLIPERISGTAPGADYLLLRTEDPVTEFPVEEDFWIAGAEFADSIGADIISSSLGYFTFDDPLLNYKYSDMDGNSTFITKAADIAASKGILVVCSAGNERNNQWVHIIAPSDGDSVIAVGAVDGNISISSFSSAGPSYDGRIKPDVVAQGVSVPVQTQTSEIGRSNGTSFSCPVISGLCACVMQAVPQASGLDILTAIHSISDRYLFPDSLYGYGVPDMARLIIQLQETLVTKPAVGPVISPNPFSNEIRITFREPPEWITISIFDVSGKLVARKDYRNYVSRTLILNDLSNSNQGLYFIRIASNGGTSVQKIIKISS